MTKLLDHPAVVCRWDRQLTSSERERLIAVDGDCIAAGIPCDLHWRGRDPDRIEIPLRPFVGAHATLWLWQLGPGSWQIEWCTFAPGHGTKATKAKAGVAWPNAYNAILAGMQAVREYWRAQGVPGLVHAVNLAIARMEESDVQ